MGSARPGPHKARGVEHHIFNQAAETPVRPLCHLSFTSTDFVSGRGLLPAAILGSGRRGLLFVVTAVAQHGPGDARQLGGKRDDDDIGMCPGEQLPHPSAQRRRLRREVRHGRACAMDELCSQIAVAAFADPQQLGLAAGRVLPRCQPEPRGQVAALGEGR